jgi:MerR family mercuric resistance operon transcriptional regulator
MLSNEVSERSGCHIETIRYYERIGLLPPIARTANGYRHYTEQHLQQLCFIHRARELGFSIDDIRELMSLKEQPQSRCDTVDAITEKHLAAIQRRVEQLNAVAEELRRIASSCTGEHISECMILEALAHPKD